MKYFICPLALVLLSCTPRSDSLTAEEKAVITQEILQTLNDYYADIRKEGLSAELKYLDSTADFFWVPPGYSIPLSYDSVAFILKKNAPMFKAVDNSWKSIRIIPLSREYVTYTGQLHSLMTDTKGNVSESNLIETGFLIKRTNGWKLLCGQTAVLN